MPTKMDKNDHFSTRTKIKSYRLTKIAKMTIFRPKLNAIALPKWSKITIFRPKPKAIALTKWYKMNALNTALLKYITYCSRNNQNQGTTRSSHTCPYANKESTPHTADELTT